MKVLAIKQKNNREGKGGKIWSAEEKKIGEGKGGEILGKKNF